MILLLLKEWVLKRKSLFYIGRHDVLKAPLKGKEEKEALLKLQNGDEIIEIDGENYTMDLSDQENGNYKLNGTKADKEEVSSLYTELISIFIEKEIEDQNAERDTTEPIMTFTFHRNIEEAPDIVESFYKYEKDYAAVNINGTEFFLADIASVNDLADTIEEAFK